MQGQRGTVGSLPESFSFDHGSSSSNAAIDSHICWNNTRNPAETRLPDCILPGVTNITFMNPVGLEQQNLNGWGIGEPSSSNTQQQVSHDEGKVECGWSSSVNAGAGISLCPRLEERRYEPTNIPSLDNVNKNSVLIQSANSNTIPHGLNLNETIMGHGGDNCQVIGCHNLYESGGSGNEWIPPAGGSDPFSLHPGHGGFLVEENDGRAGSSLEARRVSCKRKAVEGNVGQSSVRGSGSYFQHGESSVWPPATSRSNVGSSLSISSPSEQLNPRPGRALKISLGSRPDRRAVGNANSSQRKLRVRINPSNEHGSTSSSSFLTANAVRHSVGSSSQQASRLPVNNSLDFRSAIVTENTNPPHQSATINVPTLPQNEQPFRWNGSSSSRTTSSSNSMPRHILEQPMFIPAPQLRRSVHNPTNSIITGGNTSVTGDVASTSRAGSSSGVHPSTAPSWVPDQNPLSRHPRRLSEYVRQSLFSSVVSEFGGQNSNHPSLHSGLVVSSHDMALPSGAGNPGHHHPYPRLASWVERQGDGVLGFPHSLRTLAAASDGRRRLASEIRNVLDRMRRGEGLRLEDVMLLDQSIFFGVADIHDRHRDMRLDVDNMSYEELLALEERIGNVCTGLNEETIASRLKQRKFSSAGVQTEAEPCCVCQEEYKDGEDVGTVECGHDFHTDCIKQWLMQKNSCPICKMTGLST